MVLAIVENMQREDLNPVEEAKGIAKMIEKFGFTQEQVSKSIGKSRPAITNTLRILKLPSEVLALLEGDRISMGHARALLSIEGEKRQLELAKRIEREGLSVRDIERLSDGKNAKKSKKPKKKQVAPEVKAIEQELKQSLGTKVSIVEKGKRGKIEIEYYSKEELERLIAILKNLD